MENYYKVLGLERGATLKEISAAYRSQALIYHPDKRKSSPSFSSAEADEKFFQIKAAYQALQDPKIRAELDLQLIAKEERLKRDEQMGVQRKQMRDDLLNREKVALKREHPSYPSSSPKTNSSSTSTKPRTSTSIQNENACLLLKCKYPNGIDQHLASEMIKSSLNSDGKTLLKLHQISNSQVAAEFEDPQAAYIALRKLPNDLIIKADWYTGHPPDDLEIKVEPLMKTNVNKAKDKAEQNNTISYSKEMEESVLERLKRRKLEKQQEESK